MYCLFILSIFQYIWHNFKFPKQSLKYITMKNTTLICLIISLLSISAVAQWSIDPAENNAISMANGEQAIPLVATAENGTTYIAWFSNESGNYDVRLQKLDVFGNFQWDSAGLLVSDHEAMSWLTDWDMTIDQEDHAILTFQDIRNINNDVFAYRISPEGDFVWGDDGIEMSTGAAFDAAPKVTVTNENNAVFAWEAEGEVMLQKISPEGEKQWGENGITLSSDNAYTWPQLIAVGDDEVILKYFEDSGPLWAPTRHVFAQRYDAEGNTVWDQPAIVSDAGSISAWTQIFPFINDGNDGFYIAWHDNRTNPTLASIYVQHIGSDGSVLYADDGIEASTLSNRNHFYAQLALPAGSEEIYVYWNEMDGDQNLRGIYGQKISSTGERLWTDNGKSFIDISTTNVYPVAARNSDEDMVVLYEETTSGMNASIKAMRIDTDGEYVWENEKIDMCTVQSEKVHSVVNSFYNDQWITTWEDSRNGAKDIYAQNIQLDGSLGPIVIPTELTVTPDSLFCEQMFENYIYINNNTNDEVTIENIYFELGWYVFLEEIPVFPFILGVNESLILDVWVIPGSDFYDPNGYEYDDMYIITGIGNYTVDIAINWDLLGAIEENNNNQTVLSAAPNPSKDFVIFSLESKQEFDCKILIFDSFGKKIKTLIPANRSDIRWNLTDQSNRKVPSGTYYYRLISDDIYETGKIIIIE